MLCQPRNDQPTEAGRKRNERLGQKSVDVGDRRRGSHGGVPELYTANGGSPGLVLHRISEPGSQRTGQRGDLFGKWTRADGRDQGWRQVFRFLATKRPQADR